VLLSDVKGQVQVPDGVVAVEGLVVDEVRTMTVDERAEGKTVFEAHVKVLDVDVLVRLSLALTPQQQAFLGRHFLKETFVYY